MSLFSFQNSWVLTFGILGNIVSIMVYLAPMPTFCRVFKRKSTEGFHAFPYVVSLFSAMLWIYYATFRSNMLLITVNSFGCFVEALYIAFFIAFAPKRTRISTLILVTLMNFAGFGLIIIFTHFLAKGAKRVQVLGWLCVSLSALVYIAPLSIVRQVLRTKSVEFLPFWLSISLVLNAVTWFFYGLLLKDLYVAGPNVVGFIFGVVQVILYFIYKKPKEDVEDDQKLPTAILNKSATTLIKAPHEIHAVLSLPINPEETKVKDQDCEEAAAGEEKKANDMTSTDQV